MKAKPIVSSGTHRTFRIAVWAGRMIGWTLLLVAIAGVIEQFAAGTATTFRVFPAAVLALAAIAWIFCLELFLHFFDHYLSRN